VSYVLWFVQALLALALALAFVFAGSLKLVMPLDALTAQLPMPGLFIRFVGVAELLGGLGLVLPGLLRIHPSLTPLAAIELVHIMLAATILTLALGGDPVLSLIPLFVGVLAAFVAYGRWRLSPHQAHRATHRRAAFQPAG
jgi:uncharacterized membrane protein YphA (DoxX/SURF4 family)